MEYAIPAGVLCAALGAAISYGALVRSRSRDDRGEGRESGIVLTELGYIRSSLEGVNKKLERMEERNLAFAQRLAAVETGVKQAHKRLDRLQTRGGPRRDARGGTGDE